MPPHPIKELLDQVKAFAALISKVTKSKISLSSHTFYAPKAREGLAGLRKSFLLLQKNYPKERYASIAFQLLTIEPLIGRVVSLFPGEPKQMLLLLQEIEFKMESDLSAEIDAFDSLQGGNISLFFPDDIISSRYSVGARILWEINTSYDAACYNACAAMIRRLVEMLIIDSFEALGKGNEIKENGEYITFKRLIDKSVAEPKLRLTRETKRILPDLKFFGDLGAHNPRAIVRKSDLDRIHNATRVAIEELAIHVQ